MYMYYNINSFISSVPEINTKCHSHVLHIAAKLIVVHVEWARALGCYSYVHGL